MSLPIKPSHWPDNVKLIWLLLASLWKYAMCLIRCNSYYGGTGDRDEGDFLPEQPRDELIQSHHTSPPTIPLALHFYPYSSQDSRESCRSGWQSCALCPGRQAAGRRFPSLLLRFTCRKQAFSFVDLCFLPGQICPSRSWPLERLWKCFFYCVKAQGFFLAFHISSPILILWIHSFHLNKEYVSGWEVVTLLWLPATRHL